MLALALKLVHVAATVLFLGNIVAGLFWKHRAERQGDAGTLRAVLQVLAESERWITLPAAAALIVSGIWLARLAGLSLLGVPWLAGSIALFALSGIAFGLGVAPLQKRLVALLPNAPSHAPLKAVAGAEYRRISWRWELWSGVSVLASAAALALMVLRPAFT